LAQAVEARVHSAYRIHAPGVLDSGAGGSYQTSFLLMTGVCSAIICFVLSCQIRVAVSLNQRPHQIPLPPPVSDNMVQHYQSVLILGSSVDRNAISGNYPGHTFTYKQEKLQHNVVNDMSRNLSIAVLQHPGVGLHGDLDGPFWNPGLLHKPNRTWRRPKGTGPDNAGQNGAKWRLLPTREVIRHAPGFCRIAFGTNQPDLVVVDSSLWDLAGWWQMTGHQATPERIEQWCNKDLPSLLEAVTSVFKESRGVFRTAPQVAPWSTERWTQANFEAMHQCVERRSAGTGEVLEHVGVIDYHEIMDKLILRESDGDNIVKDLWRLDGYHPADLPGRLYLNQIFKLLGVQPLEAPVPSDALRKSTPHVEDEDGF